MRRRHTVYSAALAAAFAALCAAQPARAELTITVDKTTQQMLVERDGAELFVWPVSTGAPGYDTPSGDFRPNRMDKDHFSKEWDDAPMPNAIFFTLKGHAIHGTTHKSIGQPVSHGCVRLAPKNAAMLFDLVKLEGMQKTRVVLTGETPGARRAPLVARRDDNRRMYSGGDLPRPDVQDGYVADANPDDGDLVAAIPQRRRVLRGWVEQDDGQQRYYVYRERPYYPPPPPPPRYGYAVPQPYPFYGR